mmetsp:Transcript_3085/g.6938  ORF Transcript_3085/g.6938 Transcript_3085/m.6938 type:complete len:222 (+) Transcript_3085:324-989(+)
MSPWLTRPKSQSWGAKMMWKRPVQSRRKQLLKNPKSCTNPSGALLQLLVRALTQELLLLLLPPPKDRCQAPVHPPWRLDELTTARLQRQQARPKAMPRQSRAASHRPQLQGCCPYQAHTVRYNHPGQGRRVDTARRTPGNNLPQLLPRLCLRSGSPLAFGGSSQQLKSPWPVADNRTLCTRLPAVGGDRPTTLVSNDKPHCLQESCCSRCQTMARREPNHS